MTDLFEYPKHVSFNCSLCARCCGDTEDRVRQILLLQMEAQRISNATGLGIEKFATKVSGSEPYIYRMRKPVDGKCFFLKESRCTIYSIRPLICRFYPFQLKNLGNNRYVFSYTNKCLGIGKDPQLTRDFFENLFNQFTKAFEENSETTQETT
ncbi:MAG: YkgJ family cysteine cluster protein [Candidatus Bathyarchaeota archaeon]|nr:YkgJ family cysteine cluster protein [Candidatus Bathyarchaeota archaeon]